MHEENYTTAKTTFEIMLKWGAPGKDPNTGSH